MRFRLRQLKLNKKLRRAFVFFIVLFLGIGFAYIQSDLNINTFLTAIKGKWEINVGSQDGNYDSSSEDGKHINISFDATLNNLEDSFSYKLYLSNNGTIDAELYDFEIKGLSAEEQEYLDVQVSYIDDQELAVGDGIDVNTTETIKVVVKYKDGSPVTSGSYRITLYVYYDKSDGYFHRRKTLYNVLEQEATKGTLAQKYTGEHKDSFTESATKDIYHWYAVNNTDATKVTNMNNVIFANHCWQMIRTTDTGGVKMIYNGEPENNKCLNTRGTHVGYASRTSQNLASNYWYGSDYTYDSSTREFKVSGTTEQTTWNATTGPSLIGKYTCKLTSKDGSCSTLYLVESYYNTSSAYVIPLNSNSNYSQFGTLQFNASNDSLSYVGYMSNKDYQIQKKSAYFETVLTAKSLSQWSTFWYGDSIDWVGDSYKIENPYQIDVTDDYSSLVGKYTNFSSNQYYSSSYAYYIVGVENDRIYYILLSDKGDHTLSEFINTYTYGENYTNNGNGTYTINNPTTVNTLNWYTEYSNIGNNNYICKNSTNNTCNELWYIASDYKSYIYYLKVDEYYKFSNSFTWDGNKYTLDNNSSVSFWNYSDNKTSLNNAHYTCWNTSGECESIFYIYYINNYDVSYINLADGKNIDDALNEMLYSDDVNAKNSTIKTGIDKWYEKYLIDYSDYLEDTIFCNNRSQINADTNGWNLNGGDISIMMKFKETSQYTTSDLSCTNDTDKFSTLNNKAKLKYNIGLISITEINNLRNANITKTGEKYWLSSPSMFYSNEADISFKSSNGSTNGQAVTASNGVRPAISLIPGIKAAYGDGSMEHPYYIDTPEEPD